MCKKYLSILLTVACLSSQIHVYAQELIIPSDVIGNEECFSDFTGIDASYEDIELFDNFFPENDVEYVQIESEENDLLLTDNAADDQDYMLNTSDEDLNKEKESIFDDLYLDNGELEYILNETDTTDTAYDFYTDEAGDAMDGFTEELKAASVPPAYESFYGQQISDNGRIIYNGMLSMWGNGGTFFHIHFVLLLYLFIISRKYPVRGIHVMLYPSPRVIPSHKVTESSTKKPPTKPKIGCRG